MVTPRLHDVGDLLAAHTGEAPRPASAAPRPRPGAAVDTGTPLVLAVRIMAERGVRWLPVVDAAGRAAGILRLQDLRKAFARSDAELAAEVRQQVLEPLFPGRRPGIGMRVESGVVIYTGTFAPPALTPLAARMTRAVTGVLGVRFEDDAGVAPAARVPGPAR